jgi:hypothetical protein
MKNKNVKEAQGFGIPQQPVTTGFLATPAIASNPANGVNNIPLNQSGAVGSTTSQELSGILTAIIGANDVDDFRDLSEIVKKTIIEVKDPNLTAQLKRLLSSMQFEGTSQTRSPQTGVPASTPQQVAQSILRTLQLHSAARGQKPQTQQAVGQPIIQQPKPARPLSNPAETAGYMQGILSNMTQQRTSQVIKKKKKTRGNPFKVLMGKVGKLLDHGLSKNQITRYLAKQKYWNNDTIEKAVDIVKDYNKKKHKKAVYELKRIILAEAQGIEDLRVNYEVISTPDLIMRKEFLQGCVDGTDLGLKPNNPRKELGVVNRILKERGLEE